MIRKATVADVKKIQELINSFAKTNAVLPRSLNSVYENLRDFFIFESDENIFGCGALHITWDNLAELRSLVVHKEYQGKGIGKALVNECIKEARQLQVKKVFLLTENSGFFKKLGFAQVDKAALPHKIWSDCVECIQFPNCNEVAMVKDIE
ncbi:MAG: N-acetyltransferase [Candidatus Omnitrophica bacterium]|nr:N-acetyltransferase [Candidatus Omnitrophota bacterium]